MGRPKAELELEGRSFLDRILDAASPVFEAVFTVTRSGEPAPTERVPAIREELHPGTSAIFGVRSALLHSGDRAWILGVDYPLLTTDILRHLRARFERSTAMMLVPVWDGQPQFLCAGYDSQLSGILDGMAQSGRRRLRDLIDEVATELIPEDELRARFGGEPLANVNYPADYESLRKAHEQ